MLWVSCCIHVQLRPVSSWSFSNARTCAGVTPGSPTAGAATSLDPDESVVPVLQPTATIARAKNASFLIDRPLSQRTGQVGSLRDETRTSGRK